MKFYSENFSRLLRHAGCLAVLITLSAAATAQNHYYVSSVGNDANDGSQTRPWRTIQECANSFSLGAGGAVCHVAPGSYSGPITISRGGSSNSQRLVFVSDVKWGGKVSSSKWTVNNGVSYVDIRNFDMTGPSSNFAVLLGSGTSRTVQYNYIHDFQNSGACPLNGVIHETTAPSSYDVIDGNVMRHMGNSACAGGAGYMAIYADGSGLRITNNIISGLIGGWAIQKQYASITDCTPGVISNNTLFNNQGGIVLNDEGSSCALDRWTIANNIVVNNGISGTGGGTSAYGINYYHMANAPNTLVSNNMVYGNLPANFAIHGSACNPGTSGCPSVNSKTDPSTGTTFVNFQSDTNASPASNYDPDNYQINTASAAVQNGTANCAPSGLTPCVPSTDVLGLTRPISSLDIGAYRQGAAASVLSPPTGLTAVVQ